MKHTLILTILVFSAVVAQEDQYNQQVPPQLDYEAQLRQQTSMKRTACLVLSRYHANAHKQLLDEIIGGLQPNDQQFFINKMYAVAIEKCMPIITIEQAQQFFIEQQHFDPSSLFYIYDGFDYAGVADNLQNLTPNQKNIIKFIKQFDEEMQVKRQEREAQKEETEETEDFGIFGIPVASFNSLGGLIYIAIFASILLGGFIWGFKQLNNSSMPTKKKKSKSPKKQK